MSSISSRKFLVPSLLSSLLFSGGSSLTYGQQFAAPVSQRQEALEYRVHKGESLEDIARIFHLSPGELARANGITNPTRLQIDQLLKVPNVFAQQVAQLQEERSHFLAEKERLARQVSVQQDLLSVKNQEIQQQATEKATLTWELAMTGYWKQATYLLVALFLGVLGWAVWLYRERNRLVRQLSILAQENAAASVAKEKYRQTVAQLELRYQKLTSPRGNIPDKFVTEGITLLNRAFAEGAARIEDLLAGIKAEREKEEQILLAEQKVFDSVFHPLRGLLQRSRLKYHGA